MTRVGIYGPVTGDMTDAGVILDDPSQAIPFKPARAAQDFRDSVAVNVHISNFSTAYGDIDQVEAALARVGITHLRDGACAGCTTTHPRQRRLSDNLGARWTWVAGDPVNTTGTIDANLARVAELFADVTDAVENPNEWDIKGGQWAAQLRDYAQRLRAARDTLLPGVPILAPSLVKSASRATLGDLSAYVDRGNMHSYPGTAQPDAGYLTNELKLAGVVAPGRTPVATETGYTTGGANSITERAAGIYLPRVYLEHFYRGAERAFAYELVDDNPDPGGTDRERHFGLFRADWTEKPAVAAIRRLLDAVGTGHPAQLGGLAYTVKSPVATHDLLLQRADGSYVLCLWRTTAAWANGGDVSTGSKTSTVTFGQPVTVAGQTPRTLSVTLPGDCVAFVELTEAEKGST